METIRSSNKAELPLTIYNDTKNTVDEHTNSTPEICQPLCQFVKGRFFVVVIHTGEKIYQMM